MIFACHATGLDAVQRLEQKKASLTLTGGDTAIHGMVGDTFASLKVRIVRIGQLPSNGIPFEQFFRKPLSLRTRHPTTQQDEKLLSCVKFTLQALH